MFCFTIDFTLPSPEGPISIRFTCDIAPKWGLQEPTLLNESQYLLHKEPEFVESIRSLIANDASAFELCEQGTGGTYFIKNKSGERVAVFKPVDEEPGAVNNPKGAVTSPLIAPGGGATREMLAYLLDNHFAGVPETHVLDLNHSFFTDPDSKPVTKTGSLQKFIPHLSAAADMGSAVFAVEDVHRIGIFDVRFLNLDRNGENLLVVKDGTKHPLIPIDHSYILPPKYQNPYFEWLYWKQAKEPFSPATLKYISDIDIESDAKLLAAHGIPESSIKIMKMCTILLKKCAAAGMTLYQIASLICSSDDTKKCILEQLIDKAEILTNNSNFSKSFENVVNTYLSEKITAL